MREKVFVVYCCEDDVDFADADIIGVFRSELSAERARTAYGKEKAHDDPDADFRIDIEEVELED